MAQNYRGESDRYGPRGRNWRDRDERGRYAREDTYWHERDDYADEEDDDFYEDARFYPPQDDLRRYRSRLARARGRSYVADAYDDDNFRPGPGYGDYEERRSRVFGERESGAAYGGPEAWSHRESDAPYGGPGGYVGVAPRRAYPRSEERGGGRYYGGGYPADVRDQTFDAVRGTGSRRGKGPRGYQRSDERIREDVSDRLTDDEIVDASDIDVKVKDCEVTLSGFVQSRRERRRAEDCAESVSGVRHVQNNVRVRPDQPRPAQGRNARAAREGGDDVH